MDCFEENNAVMFTFLYHMFVYSTEAMSVCGLGLQSDKVSRSSVTEPESKCGHKLES